MVQFLCLNKTDIPPHLSIPKDIHTVLVFEPTMHGYKAAIDWIRLNGWEGVCRIVIPFSNVGEDPTTSWPSLECTFPLYKNPGSCSIQILTEQSLDWFQECIKTLKIYLLLRSAKTGLSSVGRYMVDLIKKGLTKEEVLGATSMYFRFPMNDVRNEYTQLCIGHFPRIHHPDMEEWPHHIVNGSFPIALTIVRDAITAKINTGKLPLIGMTPSCPNYTFILQDGRWVSTYKVIENTIQWPYGIVPEEYNDALYTDIPGQFKCKESFGVEIQWNPLFLEGELTINEALQIWIEARLNILLKVRTNMSKEASYTEVKRKFVRSICVQEKISGKNEVVFLGESIKAKRYRIASEYGGHTELLNTPVSELDLNFVLGDAVKIPESARDLLLSQLTL